MQSRKKIPKAAVFVAFVSFASHLSFVFHLSLSHLPVSYAFVSLASHLSLSFICICRILPQKRTPKAAVSFACVSWSLLRLFHGFICLSFAFVSFSLSLSLSLSLACSLARSLAPSLPPSLSLSLSHTHTHTCTGIPVRSDAGHLHCTTPHYTALHCTALKLLN